MEGFHRALTISIANSVWLGVGAAAVALIAAVFLREIPLRTSLGPARAGSGDATSPAAPAGAATAAATPYRTNPAAD